MPLNSRVGDEGYNNPTIKQNSKDARDLKDIKDKELKSRQIKMNSNSKKNRIEPNRIKK